MTSDSNLILRDIRDDEERIITLRFAQGHDTLRIAAGVGRGTESIALTLGAICGFDRGRAQQAVRAYDTFQERARRLAAASPRVKTARPAGRDPRIAELEATIRNLKTRLDAAAKQADAAQRELLAELREARQHAVDAATELVEAHGKANRANLEAAHARRQVNARDKKISELADHIARLKADTANLRRRLVRVNTAGADLDGGPP